MIVLLYLLCWLASVSLVFVLVWLIEVVCILASLTGDDFLTLMSGDDEAISELADMKWAPFHTLRVAIPLNVICALIVAHLLFSFLPPLA